MAMRKFGNWTIDPRDVAAVGVPHPRGGGNADYVVEVALRGAHVIQVLFPNREAADKGAQELIGAAASERP